MEHHTTATDPGVASAHCHGMTPTTMSSSSSSANGSSVSGNGRRRSSRKSRSLRHSVDIVVTRFKRILNPRPRKPSLNCRCDNDSIVEGQNGELSARPNAPYDVNAADASTAAACSKTPTSTSTSNSSSSSRPSRQQQRQRSSSSSSSLHKHHNPHHHHHLCDTTSSSSFSTIRDNNNSSHNHSEQYRPRAFSVGMQLLRRISLNTKGHDQTTITTPTTTTNGTGRSNHHISMIHSNNPSSAVVNPATSPKLSGVSATSSITSVSLENVSDTNNNHHNSPDTDEFIINSRMQRVSEGEEDDHEDLSHDTTTTTIAAVDGVPCERQRASTLTASSHCYPSKVEEEEAASASSSDLMLSTSPVKHSFLRLNTDPIECATYGSTSDDNDNDNDNNEDSNDDTGYAPDDQGSSFSRDTDVYITSQIDSLSVTEDAIPTITTSTHFIEDLTTSSPTNHMKTSPTTINLISRDSILASSDDGEHYHQHGGSRPSSTNNGGIKRTQTPMFSTARQLSAELVDIEGHLSPFGLQAIDTGMDSTMEAMAVATAYQAPLENAISTEMRLMEETAAHPDAFLLPPPGQNPDGSLKTPPPLYPGLEDFRLLEKMGDGAFSKVFKAYDLRHRRPVAIKVVRKYQLSNSQRASVLKEAAIMRGLSHPNIARLYGFRESDDYYYLILELLTGGELFHRIVKLTYFSEDLARHVILQVADGIRYLHEEKGVVHRDIKPENILFEPIPIRPSGPNAAPAPYDEDKVDEGIFVEGVGGGGIGRVKLADFGLSKEVWGEQTMTPCGTVGYTAPEIVKDERYSMGVDMWALGCVLYTMLCGFPPFYDENVQMLTEKVARGQYSFLSPWWDDISSDAKDLITHLLKVDPRERYTIGEFLAHPWVQGSKNNAEMLRQAELAAAAAHLSANDNVNGVADQMVETPFGTRAAGLRRRLDIPVTPLDTPEGAFAMKAAFDVSYAARRRRDASARRKQARQGNRAPAAHQQTATAAASDVSPFDAAGAALAYNNNNTGDNMDTASTTVNAIMNLQNIELTDRHATPVITHNGSQPVAVEPAPIASTLVADEADAYYNHFRTSQYYATRREDDSDTPTSEDDDQPMVVMATDDSEDQQRRHKQAAAAAAATESADNVNGNDATMNGDLALQRAAMAATLASVRRNIPPQSNGSTHSTNGTNAAAVVAAGSAAAANNVANVSPANSRRTRKPRANFDLKLDNATLLRRRQNVAA